MKWFGNTPVSPSWGCRDQDGLGTLDEDELAARGCGEGEGEGKKENPTSLVVLKEKGLPTLLSLFLPPDFF